MRRRTLVKLVVWTSAAVRAMGLRAFAEPALSASQVATLRAAARVVLPSEPGAPNTDETVDRFLRWTRNYKAGAEMDHGYGFTRLRSTPPSSAAAYPRQLEDLERDARQQGSSFARLDSTIQRRLLQAAFEAARVDALPQRPAGRHVVADLMGFYFYSSEANDLCYRAEIGRDTCGGLPGSDRPPEPRRGS
jgi:hypothetical protein